MDHEDSDNSNNHHHLYRIIKPPPSLHSFEIRLFYFRISPCAADIVPDHLTVRHLLRELGVSLEINGAKIPSSDAVAITLRRDRVDKETAEVTYVSTDNVRVTGAIEFEVLEGKDLILCGSLERMGSGDWVNNGDGKTGWSMDYYVGEIGNGSAFFQPKLGILSPSFEVYIAGCCSGVPVILSKTVQVSPRRKMSRQGMLDAIPEGEEGDGDKRIGNGALQLHKPPVEDAEVDNYEPHEKFGHSYYSDDMYTGEDGQLTWFNAGVRVGVGIGLGICLGVGIGVGLIMHSYQATTRSFRRRFF